MSSERPAAAGRFRIPPLMAPLMVYVWSVIAGGLSVAVLAIVTGLSEGFSPVHWGMALLFGVCMLAADVRPVSWRRDEEADFVTVSMAYSAAMMFLLPGYGAALIVGAGSILADACRRLGPIKIAFNAAMMMLTMASGIAVLRAGGAQDLIGREETGAGFLATVLAANVVLYCVNTLLISIIVALVEGSPVTEIIRRDFFLTLPTDGILLPLGPVLVVVGDTHPVLLPFAMLLTLAVYTSAKNAAERTRDATIDPLTGLVNRRLFDEEAEAALERSLRQRAHLSLLLMDLDGFKEINDTLGHHVGDEVLVEIAKRLADLAPPESLVARLGGDEFAVLLPGVASEDEAMRVARHMATAFDERVCLVDEDDLLLTIGGSIGVGVSCSTLSTVSEIARAADAAMYQAKRTGMSVLLADPQAFTPDNARDELAKAIEGDELFLQFQPIIDTRTRAVLGFEALVRWEHPTRGILPPIDFVPLAETSPLIHPLTTFVLREALVGLGALHRFDDAVTMSVNVSARNLADPAFATEVRDLLRASEVRPDQLILEITESAVMENVRSAMRTLQQIRDMGVGIALDDFGAGYSSLSKLRDLPVTILKIDRSFTGDLESARGIALLKTIVDLAQSLGLRTTAEGIEDQIALTAVGAAGCGQAQGYHISRPMALGETKAWLAGRASIDPFNGRLPEQIRPEEALPQ